MYIYTTNKQKTSLTEVKFPISGTKNGYCFMFRFWMSIRMLGASDSTLLGQATPLTGLSNKVLLLAWTRLTQSYVIPKQNTTHGGSLVDCWFISLSNTECYIRRESQPLWAIIEHVTRKPRWRPLLVAVTPRESLRSSRGSNHQIVWTLRETN